MIGGSPQDQRCPIACTDASTGRRHEDDDGRSFGLALAPLVISLFKFEARLKPWLPADLIPSDALEGQGSEERDDLDRNERQGDRPKQRERMGTAPYCNGGDEKDPGAGRDRQHECRLQRCADLRRKGCYYSQNQNAE